MGAGEALCGAHDIDVSFFFVLCLWAFPKNTSKYFFSLK